MGGEAETRTVADDGCKQRGGKSRKTWPSQRPGRPGCATEAKAQLTA